MPRHESFGVRCSGHAGEWGDQLASMTQGVSTLGTLEAEYVALSEAAKQVLFLRQVKKFVDPSIRIGVVDAYEDKEGAIKLANNGHRTEYNVKHHPVRDAYDAQVRIAYLRPDN